jgi:hypothetical protein
MTISDLTEKTEPPPPLTQREMAQFVTLSTMPTLERALERLRWLEAESAALKAHDPLAEMWAALAEYQPMADADGYGEAWRIMCRERTAPAAERAHDVLLPASSSSSYEPWLAALSARWAIEWEETSRRNVREAIEAIRRAKEARL